MKLSVALCTYNGSLFLNKQLDSILNQTIPIHEIVICDDNSTDETIAIINSYKNKYPKLIKVYQNNPGLGTIKNFEKAIQHTSGDLIFLSDQDDIWYYEKVARSYKFFEENQECVLLFSNGNLINSDDKYIGSTLWDKWGFDEEVKSIWKDQKKAYISLVNGNNKITGATVCFKKSLKSKIFPIKLPLNYWHDGWLGTHAAAQEGLFFINESLIQYRIHSNQQVGISKEGLDDTIFAANRNFIARVEYFDELKKIYPHLKKYLPYPKKKSILKTIILKIKRGINLLMN
ncbi:hypothetical protein B4N84_14290 [Flavobacterium sp. IR1]|nr:hypothetical protein B4N84_14290 [Flavobacterium sp. IR1]